MTKKKTIDLRSVDPTPVPAGDVNIIYNGTRIGGFSEDTEAVLKTGGCRVEHDINVNYVKPSGLKYVAVSITGRFEASTGDGTFFKIANDEAISVFAGSWVDVNSECNGAAPVYNGVEETYALGLFIDGNLADPDHGDIYNITLNGSPVPYLADSNGYSAYLPNSATYPTEYTLVVTEKQH